VRIALLIAWLAAQLPAQVTNDTCALATPIAIGTAVVATNAGATAGPDPVGCLAASDVWFSFVASCNSQHLVSTCAVATTFDTIVSVWGGGGGCGALVLTGCNDNNCAVGGPITASRVTFTATAGTTYYVSVGGKLGATGTFGLLVSVVPATLLSFSSFGPGTIGYAVSGPPNGAYYLAMTAAPGAFPFGWFYGLDMPLFDILAQFNSGPPFVGVFSPCGAAAFGPVGGAPSGLTLYAVAVAFAPGAQFPTSSSNPTVVTVP
jgi:hypothetical protein